MERLAGLTIAAIAAALVAGGDAAANDIVIHAGILIDGVAPTPRESVSIVIHGSIGRYATVYALAGIFGLGW